MNASDLEKSLLETPETSVKVSAELHQDIMRAVRLAGAAGKHSGFNWAMPALGAGLLATIAIVMFFFTPRLTNVAPSPVLSQEISQNQHPTASLQVLQESLLAFSKKTQLPEEELRKEVERLKSDLERFDIRS